MGSDIVIEAVARIMKICQIGYISETGCLKLLGLGKQREVFIEGIEIADLLFLRNVGTK